jgi:GH18 family chitinase
VDPTTGKIVVTPVVKSDLVALAKGLRDAKSDIILTFPAPAVNPNDPAHTEQLNFKKVAPHVDKFSVMTYTGTYGLGLGWASWFVSPLTGDDKAHFPVTIDQNLKLWTEDSVTKDGTTVTTVKGVPKDKLLMGIGAFAICYPRKGRDDDITEPRQMTLGRDQPGHEDDKITGGDNDFPLGDVFARNGTLDKNPAARHVDTITQQSYLSLPASVTDGHCGQASRYIPYDDEDSIVAKGKWSQTNGYGGTIVWTLQQLLLPSPATGATPTKPDGMSPDTLFQALKKGFLT